MKQFLKRFRIPALILCAAGILAAGALIAARVHAGRTPQAAAEGSPAEDPAQTAVAAEGAASVVFSDGAVQTDAGGDAVEISGTAVTVRAPGIYTLSGTCANGSVTVRKQTEGVTLVLDGLHLTADGTAAICCNKGSEVTIRAAEGSVNTLADTESNNDETDPANTSAENAVIKAKDGARLTLCGTGALEITANGRNGVKSGASSEEFGEASLTISELTLSVTAVNDGIKADTALRLLSGTVTLSAGGDGIGCDGSVSIGAGETDGPVLRITRSEEGIEGAEVSILSGDVAVASEDDGINASSDSGTPALRISGGTLRVDAATGDGLDSNGKLTISGGDVTVFSSSRADNCPLDSESGLEITGGTVLAIGAGGMAELPTTAAQCYVTFGASGMGGFGGRGSFGGRGGFGPMGEANGEGAVGPTAMGGVDPLATASGSGVSISAGDTVQILAADGTVLAETTAPRAADYVFYSDPAIADGESFTLCINGTQAATATAGTETGAAGGFGGRPGEGFDPENMPQMPTGEGFDPENMPQMPEGEGFDPENMPQMPEGEGFDPENMPRRPGGGFGGGQQPPGGFGGGQQPPDGFGGGQQPPDGAQSPPDTGGDEI